MSPLLNRRTTLKDALSMLLDADVQAGIVVDRRGAVLGLVTADMIADVMREGARRTEAEPLADVAAVLEEVGRRHRAGEAGTPMTIDWAWIADHLDELAAPDAPAPRT